MRVPAVRIVWIRYGIAFKRCSRNSHAVRRSPIGLVDQLGDRELAGAVDADEQVKLAFGGLHLSDIDVKEADRIALEALALRLVTLDVRQAGDAVPLEASMQRRSGQMRDRRLQCVEAVVQRQQGMPAERDDGRLLSLGQGR